MKTYLVSSIYCHDIRLTTFKPALDVINHNTYENGLRHLTSDKELMIFSEVMRIND